MKRFSLFLLGLLMAAPGVYAQGTWTINVGNDGTRGGYTVESDGQSVGDMPFTGSYPVVAGYVPAWYIRFPRGNYTVTSTNNGTIDVHNMNADTDISTGNSAKNFSFRAPSAGWYRFILRGGTPGATIRNFKITSSDVSGASAVYLADWRSAPSLHLNGFESTNNTLPRGNAFDWIYDEVLIPADADFTGTYVEAFGFHNGYIGIQNNGPLANARNTTNHTIIFSSWDNGDTDADKALADYKRSGVIAIDSTLKNTVAERFGGEGTGVHVILNGDYWKPGHWVRFLLNVRPEQIRLKDGSNYENTIISAWYNVRGIDDKWHYISSQRMAGQTLFFGNGFNAFLEEFTRYSTSQGNAKHKAYYRRIFTRSMQGGEWYNRNTFSFGHTDGGTNKGTRNDRYQTHLTYDGEPAVYMQSGGYIEPKEISGSFTIKYKEAGDFLPSDETLAQLVKTYVKPAIQAQDRQRMQTAMHDAYSEIPQSKWSVKATNSQETTGEPNGNGWARLVLDGDNGTYWHTAWQNSTKKTYPYNITFSHQGSLTIDRITLTTDANHSSAKYIARTVQLQTASSINGPWSTVGTYTLPQATAQSITLDQSLTLPEGTLLRLNFTQGYAASGENFVCLAEVKFYNKNSDALRRLVQEHIDGAGTFNHYPQIAVNDYLRPVYEHLATATAEEMSQALTTLSQRAQLIKYGPTNVTADLNAERAYVVTNAYGYGTLIHYGADLFPSLRGSKPTDGTPSREKYAEPASLTLPETTWVIVGSDRGTRNNVLMYNLGTGKFLNPASGGENSASSMSDTPVFVKIRRAPLGFVITPVNATTKTPLSTDLCANPQAIGGYVLTQSGHGTRNGNFWIIRDNFSITPSPKLIAALREAARTGKFNPPTGINTIKNHGTQSGDGTTYDLSGRRTEAVHSGDILISQDHKMIVR